MTGWDLLVRRDDLALAELRDAPVTRAGEGEAVLRVDRVGLTANNVTYALFGDAMRYWDFFPADPRLGPRPALGLRRGRRVAAPRGSPRAPGCSATCPPSSHLLVRPGRVRGGSFVDTSAHRAALPSPVQRLCGRH